MSTGEVQQEVRRHLDMALDATQMGTWEYNMAEETAWWDDRLYGLLGYDKRISITQKTFFEHIHPDDRQRVERELKDSHESGQQFASEFRIVRRDGKIRWFASRARIIRDRNGTPLRMCGLNYDVTNQKETEEHLQDLVDQRTNDLRILNKKLAEAQEQERQRIAVGLHDEVGQLLAACQFRIMQARECDKEQRVQLIEESNEILNTASDQIRGLTFELQNTSIFHGGFIPAVRELCQHMENRHGVHFEMECQQHDLFVPKKLRPCLYHCLRELMYNVVKHAGVSEAEVRVEVWDPAPQVSTDDESEDQKLLRITVRDYGCGFLTDILKRPLTPDGGFGLYHIRERLADLDGTLRIESIPGDGTKAVVEIDWGEEGGW